MESSMARWNRRRRRRRCSSNREPIACKKRLARAGHQTSMKKQLKAAYKEAATEAAAELVSCFRWPSTKKRRTHMRLSFVCHICHNFARRVDV